MKKTGSLTNILKSLNKEEYGQELRAIPPKSKSDDSNQKNSSDNQNPNDAVISEMAKGFLEAQAKMTSSGDNGSETRQMIELLQKISNKLDNLNTGNPAPTLATQPIQENEKQPSKQNNQEAAQQAEQNLSEELKGIFNQLLTTSDQKLFQIDNSSNNNNNSSNNNTSSNANTGEQSQKSITVQTAAQVLAKAQYELSNELEASLTKLKQVISESEKIANRISNLLGEESGNNNS